MKVSALALLLSTHQALAVEKDNVWVYEVPAAGSVVGLADSERADAIRDSLVAPFFERLPGGETLAGRSGTASGFQVLHVPLATQRFTQGNLSVAGAENATFYLNGVRVADEDEQVALAMPTGDHQLLVFLEGVESWQSVNVQWEGKADHDQVDTGRVDEVRLSQTHVFDAPVTTAVEVSASGQYVVWRRQHFSEDTGNAAQVDLQIYDVNNERTVYRWNQTGVHSFAWHPEQEQLAWVEGNRIQLLTLETLEIRQLTPAFEGVRGLQWANSDTLIFSWNKEGEQDGEMVKRYRALEDRWSYFRDVSQLFSLQVESGVIQQLTNAAVTSSLEDVHSTKNKLLLSRSVIDYREPAHYLVELYELNMTDGEEVKLGEYRTFNQAFYLNNDLYVVAGPEFGDGAGRALPEGMLANNYDGQLYRMMADGNVEALSKDFDPAIGSAQAMANGEVLLRVTERDTTQLYRFLPNNKSFVKVPTGLDIVDTYSVTAASVPTIFFAGTEVTRPSRMGYVDTESSAPSVLWDSYSLHYRNVDIHDIREWNFRNDQGDTIFGRIYLPPQFDSGKKYPALVYYYGGTSPVQRAFTGRYPFNQWAAQGYVVYVVQPSGATGFGQEFSARHVNAWGEYTAQEIITGTERFLAAHSFVDADRVGHLGASYGGFMTMLLATMTDIYSASMSHAGISNITSYWGQGWWGFLYSGEASKGSFPWNNEQLYTYRSPVFHADQITAPMLLIHGDADTNVPPGESHNMFTALKLLGKDVELVEYKGADHHIIARDERFHWWDTYMAFFDKYLKGEPEWWDHLYPEEE